MRLKSLDIKGFKSFADKTQILLDNPITGIVGPNGCGKSNIIDAIRWVIGEHKIKSLRSDNLEDLVFNGSRSRSASGMAEVSLTFENTRNLLPTEFTTVTITRKFYKSGESEYRLNDVTCRLKDIHNLFLDTGVSNDSYAIIELGMVDDIIKDKEGSRRRMLEQAAGISIYKTRKKEAKQKLDATQQDLSRIEDLLFEIGNNLRTLESQARKAERYFQIKNEYKEISVELAKASLEEFNEKYQALNEQHEIEQDKKMKIETEISGDEAVIEANKVKLVQKEQELNGLQKQFNELVNRIRQLESDKKLAAQRLDHLQDREKSLNQFLGNAGEQLKQLKESIAFAEQQITVEAESLQEQRDQLENLRNTLDEKRETFDIKKRKLEEERHNLQQFQRRQFDAEKKVAVADTSVMNLQRSMQQIQEEKAQRALQIAQLNREKQDTDAHLQQKQDDLQALVSRHEAIKNKILESQEQLESLRARSVEENRKLDARRNEHDLLKSLVDSLEGYPDSIKFLKKNKEWNSNAPLLSDIFVARDEYRTALEYVLDSYLNYYVVKDVQEAAQAVQLLESHKKGKANFFLLDQFGAGGATAASEPQEGLVPAMSVIQVDEQYKALAQHLLGHVYIAESTDNVTGATVHNNNVIIEKSGKTLRGKYNLGGGSIGLFEGNKIGRAKNLERLASDIESLTTSTAQLKQQISETQTRITGFNQELNDRAIDQARNEINKLSNQAINLGHRIENYEQLNLTGEKRLQDLQDQFAELQEGISDTRTELEEITEQLQSLQAAIQKAAEEFAAVEQDFNMATQQYNNQNIQHTRQQSKIENLKQEFSFRNNQLTDLERQITSNREQLKETSAQISETSGKLHFGDNELYELMQKKDVDERNLSEKDRTYYEFRNAISEHESKISRQRREKEQAETLLSGIREKLGAMKLQVAGMKERLNVEFKVDLEAILEEGRKNDMTVEELNAEADRLKKRLENIGEVNPTAIEAYSEMKVRHDFIVDQKKDLEDAHNTLMATIEEIENTANAKFRETFDAVRTNFVQVFKALFTEEDAADLKLTDPDNIADSGIEIYAQPKGKRPSTLTQLSGGEKTLTSTAFLFAIYLIKPAPFCILDEVDAPLDDANVGKFTQMIRKFSDNSQFIIVTHNKQTMAAVDVIYGVTMQEAGVSKLVPVDFRSLN
ncbi:chromosome segregation protein SMC [Taibaiella chishuiensis]|uniref:Chromosome partition protein Smc n=1 Tax=Taibaiella chishuiensis TaxID=1434707 RepID=A0A2P8DCZ1_9BACT|nr:chromosome segregation protein SMC [Taibaiella chishuiensis]PSK95091.1 condensin subunit Smc [Taibaiella chishuiensis]